MELSSLSMTFIALGAFWAGTSTVFNGMKMASELKIKIIQGSHENTKISIKHRRRMIWSEWIPAQLSLFGISITLALIIVVLPGFAEIQEIPDFPIICKIASIVPFAGAVTFLVLGIVDWLYLNKVVSSHD